MDYFQGDNQSPFNFNAQQGMPTMTYQDHGQDQLQCGFVMQQQPSDW
jgi:hypothetical protein